MATNAEVSSAQLNSTKDQGIELRVTGQLSQEDLELDNNESDFEGNRASKESDAFEDQTGYYERFWNRWFRVDADEVLSRLGKSLMFWSPALIDTIKTLPDLYGPFWIYSSLAFMLGASGNMDAYINSTEKQKTAFIFDFLLIGRAFFFVYFVGFLTPICIGILMRATGKKIISVKIMTIYGYSYFIFFVASVLALHPKNVFKWCVMLYAGITSMIHLNICIQSEIRKLNGGNYMYSAMVYVSLIQIIIMFLIKELFFDHIQFRK